MTWFQPKFPAVSPTALLYITCAPAKLDCSPFLKCALLSASLPFALFKWFPSVYSLLDVPFVCQNSLSQFRSNTSMRSSLISSIRKNAKTLCTHPPFGTCSILLWIVADLVSDDLVWTWVLPYYSCMILVQIIELLLTSIFSHITEEWAFPLCNSWTYFE